MHACKQVFGHHNTVTVCVGMMVCVYVLYVEYCIVRYVQPLTVPAHCPFHGLVGHSNSVQVIQLDILRTFPTLGFFQKVHRNDMRCGRIDMRCGRIDMRCGRSDMRCGRIDRRCGRIDTRCGRSDMRCGRSDIRCGRSDTRCGRSDMKCSR